MATLDHPGVITDLVLLSGPALTIQVMDIQRQNDGNVCGVLAIAIAHAICSQHNILEVTFDEKKCRNHLKQCVEKGAISKRWSKGKIYTKTYKLHCTCKMPEDKEVGGPNVRAVKSGSTSTA